MQFIDRQIQYVCELPVLWGIALSYWVWYTTQDIPFAVGFMLIFLAMKSCAKR